MQTLNPYKPSTSHLKPLNPKPLTRHGTLKALNPKPKGALIDPFKGTLCPEVAREFGPPAHQQDPGAAPA